MFTLHAAPVFDAEAAIAWLNSTHREGVTQAEAHAFGPDDADPHSEAACGIVSRLIDNAIAAGVYGPGEQQHQRIRAWTVLDEDNYAGGIVVAYTAATTAAGALTVTSEHIGWTELFAGAAGPDAAHTALSTVYRTAAALRNTLTAAIRDTLTGAL